MNTTLELTYAASPGIYWIIGLCLTVAITIIAFISKSPLAFLAAMICWTGCYFELPLQNTLYAVGMGLMIIVSLIAGIMCFVKKRNNEY